MAKRKRSTGYSRAAQFRQRALVACLVASGAAALTYEVLWLRQLSLVMGHTVYALAAVLDAFLGGLALGAWLGGRWVARRGASLKLYALVEVGIAVSAVAMPWLIRALSPVFGVAYRSLGDSLVSYSLVQFLACGLLLLVPTILIGTTLPIVTALLVREDGDVARGAGGLYAANSFGGVLGAGLAGFFVLPALGILGTGFAAATVNLSVAALAVWLARRDPTSAKVAAVVAPRRITEQRAGDWPVPRPVVLMVLYGVSGFAALALEVGWARVVSLSIGSTTYGFTIILVTYITGLALGSWILPHFRSARDAPVRWIVALHAVIALWSLVTLPYLGTLPVRVARIVGSDVSFAGLLSAETITVGLTIIIPTLAMGGMFPLVSALISRSVGSTGRAVGSTYAANTVGNILGSFVAGFILVPTVGMRTTIVVAASLSAAVGLAYMAPALKSVGRPAMIRAGLLAGATVLAVILAPAWDRNVVTSGPYLYGGAIVSEARGLDGPDGIARVMRERFELIDYREGASTVATVKRHARTNVLHLQVGGKSDAFSYASTQNLIAHLPLLLHGSAKDVLIVGLGSGSTLGSALLHPVERVDCIEISAEVRDMAREHFSQFTGNALEDPRANVRIADGRNHLRHANRTYDVIVSQPSNPWISGAAGLFTREYFQDVRDHLRPSGVACSWFKFSDESGETMRSVLRSWDEVFDNPWLFESRVIGEFVLVGFAAPGPVRAAPVVDGLKLAAVRDDLDRISLSEPGEILGHLVMGPAGIAAYSSDAVLNTDDNAYLEFMGPRQLTTTMQVAMLAELSSHRENPVDIVDMSLDSPGAEQSLRRRLEELRRSKDLILQARQLERSEGRTDAWWALVEEGRRLNARDNYLRSARR